MANRSSGKGFCTKYITVTYPMEVSFPADQVVCDMCDFCRSENAGTRFRCSRTGEILPVHNKTIGMRCPLGLSISQFGEEEQQWDDLS